MSGKLPLHVVLNAQRETRDASRSAIDVRRQREQRHTAVLKAHNVLRDAILACGVPTAQGVALLAAAQSFAKAKVIEALDARIADPEAAGEHSGDGL